MTLVVQGKPVAIKVDDGAQLGTLLCGTSPEHLHSEKSPPQKKKKVAKAAAPVRLPGYITT